LRYYSSQAATEAKSTDFASVANSENATPVTSSWNMTGNAVPYAPVWWGIPFPAKV
jgi:hypothetical protein